MNRGFVLDRNRRPLMPCHPARARELLHSGKASVYRRIPFTIILHDRAGRNLQPIEFKADPDSKTSGIALVGRFQRGNRVLWAANLNRRGEAIHGRLLDKGTTHGPRWRRMWNLLWPRSV